VPRDSRPEGSELRPGAIPGESPAQPTRLVALLAVLYVTIIAAILVTGAAGMSALSGVRAFVEAESAWSKAQKEAVFALSRYLDTGGEEAHYRRFSALLAVPRGDRKARLAMSGPTPDPVAAVQGFLEGRNSPSSADEMVSILARFRDTEHIQRAVQIWERADAVVDELEALAIVVHQDFEDGRISPEARAAYDLKLESLNDRASLLEDGFTTAFAQASRAFLRRLYAAVAVMTLLLVGLGAAASAFVARQLKRRDSAVRASEQRYRLLFERNLAGIYRTTVDGRIVDCNSAFARILGYPSREDVLKISALDLYSDPGDRESFLTRLRQQRVLVNFELCLRRRDGSPVWVLANESLIDEPGSGVVMDGSLIDITDRKRAEQQRWHQANHDALTDLPNRVLFNDRLSLAILHAQRRRQPLVVMFLDLDHFKRVNDTLGHSAGDELLVKVADRLRRCIRQDDTVARVGGDEFLLLLNGITREADAASMARKILGILAEPFLVQKRELFVEASIGIGLYPGDGADAETLVTNVDTAMYRAKETGRNSFQFFTRKMQEQSQERAAMESGLRRALPRGEFVLHYQPIYRLRDRAVVGIEALVRWRHPEKGILAPRDFIPLAEDVGLIARVGEWVLRRACEQLKAWQAEGAAGLRVSVNVSPRQFQQRDFAVNVRRIVKETGLEPGALDLEITESIAMHDVAHTGRVLAELADLGIQISMDDFGTGHSSLNYLKHFPIRRLKIDQSFIAGMTTDDKDHAIVATVISIARNLGLAVTAEGVETEEQAAQLAALACEDVQGYLFARPEPAEDVGKRLGLGPPFAGA
jgi:diguanylate cyclase (GGDEF)-like protein/PAS domain S-box-containing protein